MNILFSWIDFIDIKAASGDCSKGNGPLYQAIISGSYDFVWLLSDWEEQKTSQYVQWISGFSRTPIVTEQIKLTNVMHYGDIYESARRVVEKCLETNSGSRLTYHLSPGTSAMAAIWLLLAKTTLPATLIQSSIEKGVVPVNFPFNLAADYLPELIRETDNNISNYVELTYNNLDDFKKIIHRSKPMQRVINNAIRHSTHTYSVLILGETGTGKELIAQAIHNASSKQHKRCGHCIPVNCGAISDNIVESELFGSVKGAFTGAEDRLGYILAAHNGTLFLDEIGELPLSAQVKLLRVLQERKVTKVGTKEPISVDFRLVCATHRNLVEEVRAGRFREDLFHRIAIALILVPPLRERPDDINLLADHFLSEIRQNPFLNKKSFSVDARNYLKEQLWPGNIRELQNTIIRAALSASQDVIKASDLREALFDFSPNTTVDVMNKPLGNGFKAEEMIDDIKEHYAKRAWTESGGRKKIAADLLGIKNYQTLSKWWKDIPQKLNI